MSRLILIKHASPEFVTSRPADEWHLSAAGRARCQRLAERLRPFAPDVIVTSDEPKARETGEIVAQILRLPAHTQPGLHEHRRRTVPWYDDYDVLKRLILTLFDKPDMVVHGEETANAAYDRFGAAVDEVIAQYPEQTVAISTHGTVMSLFAQHRAGVDPKPLWESLQLPSFIIFHLPSFAIESVVPDVVGEPHS